MISGFSAKVKGGKSFISGLSKVIFKGAASIVALNTKLIILITKSHIHCYILLVK